MAEFIRWMKAQQMLAMEIMAVQLYRFGYATPPHASSPSICITAEQRKPKIINRTLLLVWQEVHTFEWAMSACIGLYLNTDATPLARYIKIQRFASMPYPNPAPTLTLALTGLTLPLH